MRSHWTRLVLIGFLGFSSLQLSGCSKSAPEAAPMAATKTPGAPAPAGNPALDLTQAIANYRTEPPKADVPFANVQLPATTALPKPSVVLKTSQGEITIQLDLDKAPRTVGHFLNYVNSGHYNETIFHQVESGYALVAGGFTADLKEKPTRYTVANEAANGLKNRRGTIAMARQPQDPNSATSQFIINLADNPALDHQGNEPEKYGYCVFGEITAGLDVLEKIAAVQVRDTETFVRLPVQPVTIQQARVVYASENKTR